MSCINIEKMSFAYEGSYDNIFTDVSFRIDTDWKLGFIGRNGRGKTTFLNLLLGKYEYSGTISTPVRFEYFPYDVQNKNSLTIDAVKNVCDVCSNNSANGGRAGFAEWELVRELSLLEVPEDVLSRPFCTLSNGEQTKVLLAILFLNQNSFPLIDEPTNHLDMAARSVVSGYLKSKKGFILVSHDRAFVDNCADHILSINKTNIEVQRGNFSSWLLNKERTDNFELSENEKLTKEIKKLRQAAKRSGEWADKAEWSKIGSDSAGVKKSLDNRAYIGEKSRRMQKRRKSIERRRQTAIEDKSRLLGNTEQAETLKISERQYHTERLASLSDVSVLYAGKPACQNVSFTIERGDRIAICGKNGTGKSSIIKLICGEEVAYTGEFIKGSRLEVSYVPQDASFLSGNLSDYAPLNGIDEPVFKAILRKLGFSRAQFDKDMSDFSAGQKKKVLIAKSICDNPNLRVWDEPLNFIDIYSRIQIERLLLEYKPTILFVEHDGAFCENIATKKVYLR